MNIILICPTKSPRSYGLRIIASCLKNNGHKVRQVFLFKDKGESLDENEITQFLELVEDVDLVGFTVINYSLRTAAFLTKKIKEYKDIPVIWGGPYPTADPEGALEHADMVCVGEGEISTVELLQRLENGVSFQDIPGIWLNTEDGIVRNGPSPLPEDLDSLPFPDYECEDDYFLHHGKFLKFDSNLFAKRHGATYQTMTTRGCVNKCAYCNNSFMLKIYEGCNYVRMRSVKDIIEELLHVRQSMPFVKIISIIDDLFFIRPIDQIREFAEEYKDKIGLPLYVHGLSPGYTDYKKLKLLTDCGLKYVKMGIQSASPRTKNLYKRYTSNEDTLKAVGIIDQFREQMLPPGYDIILDNPWETDKELCETLDFMLKLPTPYKLNLASLTFFPGTELYEKAITEQLDIETEKSLLDFENSFINRIFFLLSKAAARGIKISQRQAEIMTGRRIKLPGFKYIVFAFIHYKCSRAKEICRTPSFNVEKGYS